MRDCTEMFNESGEHIETIECNQSFGLWQIVGVQRFTCDVLMGAFVGNGLACELHRRSHQNFSIRLEATAKRYSADPRWSLIGFNSRSRIERTRSTNA